MMKLKRFGAALITLLMAVLIMLPANVMAYADSSLFGDQYDDEYDYYSTSGRYVFDYAGILEDDEIEKLEEMCAEASEGCECDFVIVTTRIGHDYETMDNYLSNFLNANGYRYDAIIYGIDMVSRADRIVTRGKAQTDISQSKLDNIRESCEDDFSDGDFYDGLKKFVKRINRILTNNMWVKLSYALPLKIGIAAVVAVIAVLIMMSNAKARMTVSCTEYTKNHQFKVNDHRDVFINTTVVTRKIESSSGGHGGGGGGNHGSGGHF